MDGKSILMMLGGKFTNVGKCSQYKGSYKTMQTFVLIFKNLHYMKKMTERIYVKIFYQRLVAGKIMSNCHVPFL